ncbi:UNVERIFIED_CONTAM: hypothetical protein GTU68_032190 [Idotea baltica]|nr:hypothetical protein [Idotea baltica]
MDTNEHLTEREFVELADVSRVYKTRSDTVAALADFSVSIKKGERVALLGRSGSGKSTLLNLLGGLDRPTSGTIHVDQQELSAFNSEMIFQAFNLIPTRTAVQNVEMPFIFSGVARSKRREKAMAMLESVGLKDRANHRPTEMSGGEQQRVAVARALANKPSLLLADEPTGNLDSTTAAEVVRTLIEYSDTNHTTVVLVTHDEDLASTFAHRTLRLFDGRLIAT